MSIRYNLFGQIEPANVYLCKPKQGISYALNGIDRNSFSYTTALQDIDSITFTVDRYIDVDGEQIESNGYNDLDYLMEVSIDDIGTFIIDTPPTTNKDADKETKEVSAKSCEWEMLSKDLVAFKINTGEDTSVERLVENNIDVSGRTINYVSVYNKYNSEYSLLDIIIKEKIPDWSVGYVNPIIAIKTPYFNIDSTNVYAFFTQDMSKYLQCIFTFDTVNRKINVYSAEEIGEDTGINISDRNLLKQLSIEPQTEEIYTRYKVFGNNELDIRQVNFGSDTIEDITYYLDTKYMPQELIDKYKSYIEYKENRRTDYINKMKEYISTLEARNELVNRLPLDSLNYDWDSFNEEELKEELGYFQGLVNVLLQQNMNVGDFSNNLNDVTTFINNNKTKEKMLKYKAALHLYIHNIDNLIDSYISSPTEETLTTIINNIATITTRVDLQRMLDGNFSWFTAIDYSELQASMYWWDYVSYTTSIIPNIDIALSNIGKTDNDKVDYNEDWKTNWDLYGTNELKAQIELYKNKMESVSEYAKPWESLTKEEQTKYTGEEPYNGLHNEYIKAKKNHDDATIKYNALMEEVSDYDEDLEMMQEELSSIANDVSIKNESFGFTEKELSILGCFYIDAEYTNENFLVTEYTTSTEKVDIELELLDYAKEDIAKQSRPQYHFSCDIDNLYAIAEYQSWHNSLSNGNFIWVSLDSFNYEKVRIVSITRNPMLPNDSELEVEFSNMLAWNGQRSDLTSLFDNAMSSTSNEISKGSLSSGASSVEVSNELIRYILNSRPATEAFEQMDLDRLVANEAQFKVVLSDYVTANVVDTKVLNAIISTVNSAFVRDLIVGHITAQDIFSTNTSTEYLKIGENNEGAVYINGSAIQFRDKDDKVYIQLGTDAQGGHSLIIKDDNGTTLLDGSGITANAIADELIVDEMVKKKDTNYNGISADKLNIDSVVTSINNGTTTIKSSLIYFDEDNQTLNTKLSEMVTDTNNQFTKYYTKEETTDAVETIIGNTTIKTSDGKTVNMKTALNTVIDTATEHTQTISSIESNLENNYLTATQTRSEISQTADTISLIVEGKDSSGNVILTNNALKVIANNIDLTGKVTFNSFDSSTQNTVNTANTNATNALNRATHHFGTCTTAAGTVAKVVTLSGFELYTGAQVTVQFTYANTAANPTLNVNSTGAKNIRVNNANISAKYYWGANNTVTFIYNGTYWMMSDTSANSVIASWCSTNDKTYIDGGKIYTNSITADKIDVNDLFAQDITADGTITGAIIKGGSITGTTITGTTIDGNSIKGGTIDGAKIIADNGKIADWTINSDSFFKKIINVSIVNNGEDETNSGYFTYQYYMQAPNGTDTSSFLCVRRKQQKAMAEVPEYESDIFETIFQVDHEGKVTSKRSNIGNYTKINGVKTGSSWDIFSKNISSINYEKKEGYYHTVYMRNPTDNGYDGVFGVVRSTTNDFNTYETVYNVNYNGNIFTIGTITSENLKGTGGRVVYANSNGKLTASSITSTQLGYLSEVTSSIQVQLNNKAPTTHTHDYLPLSGGTLTGAVKFGSDSYYVSSLGNAHFYSVTLPYGRALYLKDSNGDSRNGIMLTSDATYDNIYHIATAGISNAIQLGHGTHTSLITLATSGGVIARKKLIVGAKPSVGINSGVQLIDDGTIVLSSSSVPRIQFYYQNSTSPTLTISDSNGKLKVSGDIGCSAISTTGNISIGGNLGMNGAFTSTVYFGTAKSYSITTSGATVLGTITSSNHNPNTTSTGTTTGAQLGNANYRWKYLYAYSTNITSSDRRLKHSIDYELDNTALEKVFDSLKPCTYFMVGGSRKHMGFIAQDTEEALNINGMTIDDLSFVCKDLEYQIKDTTLPDEENNRKYLYDEKGNPLYVYGLKYQELHALEVWQIQKLKNRIKELEERLSLLEAK